MNANPAPYTDPALARKWLQAHLYIKQRQLQPYPHLRMAVRIVRRPF